MYYYKIENGKYTREESPNSPGPDWHESSTQIDCIQYAPDADGNPVLIPATVEPEPYTPTLTEVQAQRKEYIKQRRNQVEAATPFLFNSSLFDYESLSRERINSAILGSTIAAISGFDPNTVVANWRLWDNTTRDMTIADWMGFKSAEIQRSSECFATAAQLKSDIDAAATTVAVNLIDWPEDDYGTTGNNA